MNDPCNCSAISNNTINLGKVWEICFNKTNNRAVRECTMTYKDFYKQTLVDECSNYCPLECESYSYPVNVNGIFNSDDSHDLVLSASCLPGNPNQNLNEFDEMSFCYSITRCNDKKFISKRPTKSISSSEIINICSIKDIMNKYNKVYNSSTDSIRVEIEINTEKYFILRKCMNLLENMNNRLDLADMYKIVF